MGHAFFCGNPPKISNKKRIWKKTPKNQKNDLTKGSRYGRVIERAEEGKKREAKRQVVSAEQSEQKLHLEN